MGAAGTGRELTLYINSGRLHGISVGPRDEMASSDSEGEEIQLGRQGKVRLAMNNEGLPERRLSWCKLKPVWLHTKILIVLNLWILVVPHSIYMLHLDHVTPSSLAPKITRLNDGHISS
jgi:hypothetical protein